MQRKECDSRMVAHVKTL